MKMDHYFFVITIIDVFVLGTMCILTKCNETLSKRQRNWFIRSFLLVMAISVLEVVSVAVDGGPASLRWLNIASNYLGFGLSPVVPIFLAYALEKNRSLKAAMVLEGVYLLFLAASFPFRAIFYVDTTNHYMRGELFGIYIAVYFVGVLYLLAMTLRMAAKYQNKSRVSIYPIIVFLLAGTLIQVLFPQLHVTWLCVSLLMMLYFTYCSGMWQQLDGLTGLLNQKSYLNIPASLSQKGSLVVLDIDDFKKVNDCHGHLAGDRCLEEVADCIRSAYAKEGICYRIGGDEFCVLLRGDADPERCYARLLGELRRRQSTLPILPGVSMGAAPFAEGDRLEDVKKLADGNMYRMKKSRKRARAAAE